MRIIADESYIQSRTKVGELAPLVGLLVLLVSIVIIFWKPAWILLASALVGVGFIISLIGSYLGDRFVGPQAPHKRVPESLKGFDDSYTLLMYHGTPAPFVLLDPGGVTVFSVKSQGGEITYDKERDRWRHVQSLGLLRRFVGQESLGRPDRLARAEISEVRRFLQKRLPEGAEVPVRGVILFTHPDVILYAEDSPVPALRAAEVKRWLRRERLSALPEEVQKQVEEALRVDGRT